jgi:hypothetical protein
MVGKVGEAELMKLTSGGRLVISSDVSDSRRRKARWLAGSRGVEETWPAARDIEFKKMLHETWSRDVGLPRLGCGDVTESRRTGVEVTPHFGAHRQKILVELRPTIFLRAKLLAPDHANQ